MSSLDQILEGIRAIYSSHPEDALERIEDYLQSRMENLTAQQRLSILDDLQARFRMDPGNGYGDESIIAHVFELVLGENIRGSTLTPHEMLERLSISLNTIFDIVNQLITVIDATLGGGPAGDETIRHVIGAHLDSESPGGSLEEHLGKIKKAFLITQEAFKEAALSNVEKILQELDPEKISSDQASSLKFGPLKKAESFDVYESRYKKCKKWFESGRFMDDFLREFEKNCQKLFMS